MVINGANVSVDLAHFNQVLEKHFLGKGIEINYLNNHSLMALQGPKAAELLQSFISEDLSKVYFMNSFQSQINDYPVWISRAGYTG